MPVCEGRPAGLCLLNRNDKTIWFTQGDLFLCDDCKKFRFPVIDRRQSTTATGSRKIVDTRGSRSSSDGAAKSRPMPTEDGRSSDAVGSSWPEPGGLRRICSSFSGCIHCSVSDCGRLAVVRRVPSK